MDCDAINLTKYRFCLVIKLLWKKKKNEEKWALTLNTDLKTNGSFPQKLTKHSFLHLSTLTNLSWSGLR